MPARLRPHLTYANVMATLAVFIALGGTSYAAITLRANSVKSRHIANGQVKRSDLGANAVTSAKVADASLVANDFAAGQLPQGPRGDTGPAGPRGETGPPGPFPEGTLPSGRTVRGTFNIRGRTTFVGDLVTGAASYGFTLASEAEPHVVAPGGLSTSECPGTVALPEAAPGHVCLYEESHDNAGGLGISSYLTGIQYQLTSSVGNPDIPFGTSGTWAVTAP